MWLRPIGGLILLHLLGDLGRELQGATSRLEDMKKGSVEEKNCQLQLECFKCALAVKIDKAWHIEVPALQRYVNKLAQNQIDFPDAVAQVWSMRVTNFDLESNIHGDGAMAAIEKWALRVALQEQQEGTFEIDEALFSSCQPKTEEEANSNKFKRTWQTAVFSDGFMHCWRQASTGGSGAGLLVYMARSFLDSFALSEEHLPDFLKQVAAPSLAVFRGILAMAWSLPLAYGCTLDDVLYLFPDLKRTPMLKDIVPMGKLLYSDVVQDELWIERKRVYKDYTGAEAVDGNELWLLFLNTSSFPSPLTFSSVAPHMRLFTQKADLWRRTFRPECCAAVEEKLVRAQAVLLDAGLSVKELEEFEQSLRLSETPPGRKLHATVLHKMKDALRMDAAERFDDSLNTFRLSGSLDDVGGVLNTIKACQSQTGGWTPNQTKLLQACSERAVAAFKDLERLPVTEQHPPTLTEDFLKLPEFFEEITKAMSQEFALQSAAAGALVSKVVAVFDTHAQMMDTEHYASDAPVLEQKTQILVNALEKIVQSADEHLLSVTGTPFVKRLESFVAVVKHDTEKAVECVHSGFDHEISKKIAALHSISGGATENRHWWEKARADGGDMQEVFEATLDKIDPNQICNLSLCDLPIPTGYRYFFLFVNRSLPR